MKKAPAAAATTPPAKTSAREYLESIVVAFILALFIRTFIVQAFKIPTGSMEKNLLIGDHLLVNKLVYSPSAGAWEKRLLAKRPVQRGDVVVFKFPEDATRDFIKRVVALPGETVAVRGEGVYINGRLLEVDYTTFCGGGPYTDPTPCTGRPPDRFEAAGSNEGYGQDCPSSPSPTCYGPKKVPENAIFVLGDNRDNSRDSRFWEFLPVDQVKGRALLVYWSYEAKKEDYHRPPGSAEWIKDTLTALGRTRWNRFFHLVR
jgi:signal peptidase I